MLRDGPNLRTIERGLQRLRRLLCKRIAARRAPCCALVEGNQHAAGRCREPRIVSKEQVVHLESERLRCTLSFRGRTLCDGALLALCGRLRSWRRRCVCDVQAGLDPLVRGVVVAH